MNDRNNVIRFDYGRGSCRKAPAYSYLGGNEMPRVNRKSSLGHWYAPVYAPEYPRDPPKPHGCTRFVRCKGCPYPGHGFVCWQGEDTCLRTRMSEINGLEENEDDDSSGTE